MGSKDFNPSYISDREDIISIISSIHMDFNNILDVGCSTGNLCNRLKETYNAEVVGIEHDKRMAAVASNILDRLVTGDVENINLKECFLANYFDCIIFADILEHLRDPWRILQEITLFLKEGGIVVASIPNVRHYSTILNLIFKGQWPYRERGIHDKTHLRFFTLRNIKELFSGAYLKIIRLRRNYRIIEQPHVINSISKLLALPLIREFITFQYLIIAIKSIPGQL